MKEANKVAIEAEILLKYPQSEDNTEFLQAIVALGTVKKANEHMGWKKRNGAYRLAAIRKAAEALGFSQEFPDSSTVTDLPAYGRSVLQVFPEAREDGVKAIWHKTKSKDVSRTELIKAAIEGIALEPLPAISNSKILDFTPKLPVLTIADAHLGLLANFPETAEDSDLQTSLDNLMKKTDYLLRGMDPCDEALIVNVGDLTHIDGLSPTTPKSKNQLDVGTRYFQIARAATNYMVTVISRMLEKAEKVTVLNVRGNHDEETAWHVNEGLRARFADNPRVTLPENDSRHLTYTYGKNFIVATHGDSCPNSQTYQYITTRWKKEFGEANYTYVMKGHTHRMEKEHIGDVCFETFSTLTASDAWHEFKMYKSRREMSLVYLHKNGGEFSRVTCPMSEFLE